MIIWLVMQINIAMFGPIGGEAKDMIQFFSFIEILAEIIAVGALIVFFVMHIIEKRKK